MKLSTGKVAFPIEFDNGDKQIIYFNPNDKGIRDRIESFEKSVTERLKSIDTEKYKARFGDESINIDFNDTDALLNLSADQINELKEKMNIINEMEAEYNSAVKAELDIVFDSKISDVVFKYCEPFTSVIVEKEDGSTDSELYIMHFLHWLMVEIKKYGDSNQAAIQKHIGKYSK